jgi:type I restriction enzyme S subunit
MVATANEHELKKFQLLEGDVLLTKDSEDPHDIAVPALVIRTQPKFLCGYHLSIIRSNNQKFNGSYLFWALKDVSIASQLHREATGITRWAIANRHVKNSTISLPPDTEQKLIASYLNKKCVELSKLHEYIEQQILTLEQYRKSLIHECVTGKQRITDNDMQVQL